MSIKWKTEQEEHLIALVFENEVIWNKSLDEHKHSKILSDCWDSIAKDLKVTKTQAKNKWKALQTQYFKELEKQENPKSGAGASKRKNTWHHLDSMSFIKDKVYGESSGNISHLLQPQLSDSIEEVQSTSAQSCSSSIPSSQARMQSNSQIEVPINIQSPVHLLVYLENKYAPSHNDLDSLAEWNFLVSLFPNLSKIESTDEKMQCRLEIQCLLFNFLTKNRHIEDKQIQEAESSAQKMEQEKENVKTFIKENRHIEDKQIQEAESSAQKMEQEKENVKTFIKEKKETDSDDDCMIIEVNLTNVNEITEIGKKKIKKEEETADIEVKPSEHLNLWLKNPFVIKKESI